MKANYSKIMLLVLACSLPAIFPGCKKDKDDSPAAAPAPAPITAQSDPQVSFKVDGTAYSWVPTATNNVYTACGIDGPPQTVSYSCAFSTEFMFDKNAIDIEKGTTANADSAAFHNYFAPGTYPYSAGSANGIVVSYWDAAGTKYTTDQGSGSQTGSTFQILENYYIDLMGDIYVNAKVSFSCKVYSSSGAVKNITDGSGVFTFNKYY